MCQDTLTCLRHQEVTSVIIAHGPGGRGQQWSLATQFCSQGKVHTCMQAGKKFGDKRANVAELGFDRPFNKVTVLASGILDM